MSKKSILEHTASDDDRLIESLKDPIEAQAYLEVALEEYETTGQTAALLLALKDVAQAQGGIGALSQRAGLNREHLYRVLSSKSQPRMDKLMAIVAGLGFRMRLEPREDMVAASVVLGETAKKDRRLVELAKS